MDYVTLHLVDGTAICVPRRIGLMSTFVLLEQEDWFEDEMAFVRQFIRPGMTVLDVGASYGVYTLTMARALAGQGRVYALEPAETPGSLLAQSIEDNGVRDMVTHLPVGLSNREGESVMHISPNSELNSLHGQGDGSQERVRLTTLDSLMDQHPQLHGNRVDFIKLDAEGEELNVLEGGARFFAENKPLVIFEIKHGTTFNHGLVDGFRELGMEIYRLVPGMNRLAPLEATDTLDGYQLNLFACLPERAASLAEQGWLADSVPEAGDEIETPGRWLEWMASRPWATACLPQWRALANDPTVTPYLRALDDALISLDEASGSAGDRLARLRRSRKMLQSQVDAGDDSLALRLTLLRVMRALGERTGAVSRARDLFIHLVQEAGDVAERPFLPPLADYDDRPVATGSDLKQWTIAAVLEALEIWRSYSAYFHNDTSLLQRLIRNPHRSVAMDRRLALVALRQGQKISIKPSSRLLAEDCRNRGIWAEVTSLTNGVGEVETAVSAARSSGDAQMDEALPEGINLHLGGASPRKAGNCSMCNPGRVWTMWATFVICQLLKMRAALRSMPRMFWSTWDRRTYWRCFNPCTACYAPVGDC